MFDVLAGAVVTQLIREGRLDVLLTLVAADEATSIECEHGTVYGSVARVGRMVITVNAIDGRIILQANDTEEQAHQLYLDALANTGEAAEGSTPIYSQVTADMPVIEAASDAVGKVGYVADLQRDYGFPIV